MTKRFALPDTLPTPYFTIDAAGAVTVQIAERKSGGGQVVEIWRDGTILCRVFATTACMGDNHASPENTFTGDQRRVVQK